MLPRNDCIARTWSMKARRFYFILLILLIAHGSTAGCKAVFAPATSTPTPTETSTFTPLPTDTPIPTDTPTPLPTNTPTLEPTPTWPPPPKPPTHTPKPEDAILVFYYNLDEKGPYGCGETLYYVNTGVKKSDNIIDDISYALRIILNFHSAYFGSLYNPGYASMLAVGFIDVDKGGNALINLTGAYVPTDDYCDGPRFRDQIKRTVLQFVGIKTVKILINGTPIGNVIKQK